MKVLLRAITPPAIRSVVKRFLGKSAPLEPTGRLLHNKILAKALRDETLGGWRLDADTINFLEVEIQIQRPECLIEFGSGVSTICFAQFPKDLHGGDSLCRILSVEQNQEHAAATEEMLKRLGLISFVQVIHAPLKAQTIEGIQNIFYDLPAVKVAQTRLAGKASFVVVDGPAKGDLCRFGTLPLIRSIVAPGATFYLDDGLRNQETAVAHEWMKLDYLENIKLHQIGKGIWQGNFAGPSAKAEVNI